MALNVTLTELDDAGLQAILDASGKGKPPVYKAPLRELLANVAEGTCGTIAVPWNEINPEATERKTVVAGMKNALAADRKNGKEFARILAVRANTDDNLVTVVIGK